MPCEDQITPEELENARIDAVTLAELATSRNGGQSSGEIIETSTTRFGDTFSTAIGQLAKLDYQTPILYAGGISFTVDDGSKTVEESGIVYAPIISELPFTTSGTWIGDDDSRFRVIQAVTLDDIPPFPVSDYATLIFNGSSAAVGSVITLTNQRIGGDFVKINSPGHGITSTVGVLIRIDDDNYFRRIYSGSVFPEWWGAIGDGVADDLLALQSAFDFGDTELADGATYNCNNGTLTVPQNFSLKCTHKATIKDAVFEGLYSSGSDMHIQDIRLEGGSVNIGGASLPQNHFTNMTIGNLKAVNCRVVIRYVTGMKCESIDVEITDPTWSTSAMAPVCWYGCEIGTIQCRGYYTMGFQTTGNGKTDDIFATKDTKIGLLISERNPDSNGINGEHGFYILGNYNLHIDSIYSTGYFVGSGTARNAVKFRDNWNTQINSIVCDRMQIASDANLGQPLVSCQNNQIGMIDMQFDPLDPAKVGELAVTSSGSGFLEDNEINWFRGVYSTSGSLGAQGRASIIFTGAVYFENEANIQADETLFKDAEVHWPSASTYSFTRMLGAESTTFEGDLRTIDTNMELNNCVCEGAVFFEITSGTKQVTISNSRLDSFSVSHPSGLVDATLTHVDVNANEPTGVDAPNGVLRYRYLSYNNVRYDDESASTPIP